MGLGTNLMNERQQNEQAQNVGPNEYVTTIHKSSERLGVIETHYLHTEKK